MDKITLDDMKILDELRYTKNLKQMKTATIYKMQKLQKAGLIKYLKSGNKGWNITTRGWDIWAQNIEELSCQ